MATKPNVPEQKVEQWWSDQRKDVLKSFYILQNNVIKSIGKNSKGMSLLLIFIFYLNDNILHFISRYITKPYFIFCKEMIAKNEGKQFSLTILQNMRSKEGRSQYIHFLDKFAAAGIGCKKWKDNRLLKPLSHFFSISDEAFDLLTYECNNAKWIHEYKEKKIVW